MAQLDKEQIVQKMIDAGESEENIATVIQSFKSPDSVPISESITRPNFSDVVAGSSIQPTEPVEEPPGLIRQGWNKLTTPLVSKPESVRLAEESFTQDHPYLGKIGSFATDVMYGSTSALDAMLGGLAGGSTIARKAGLPLVAEGLQYGVKGLSAGVAAEGAENVYSGETWPEKVTGALQVGAGLFGMKSPVSPKSTSLVDDIVPKKERIPESIKDRPDLMDEFINTQKKEPPPAGTPWLDSEGKTIGHTTDKDGSTGFVPIDEPTSKTTSASKSGGFPKGTIVIIKQGEDVPTKVQQAMKAGFEYEGINDRGDFRFKKTSDAVVADTPLSDKPLDWNNDPQKAINQERNKPGNKGIANEMSEGKRQTATQSIQPINPKLEPVIQRIVDKEPEQAGIIREVWDMAKGTMSVDLPFITSASFRQGHSLIGTKAWRQAWAPSIKAYGSKKAFEAQNALLKADPMMHRPATPVLDALGEPKLNKLGQPMLKEQPSIMDRMGVNLTDLKNFSSREETMRSQLAERIPVWGKLAVATSNRQYASWINHARLGIARNFYDAMPDKNNEVALKQLGDAVNAFTGRGKIALEMPESTSYFGKRVNLPMGGKGLDFDKYAPILAEVLWSPKLQAANLQKMNPINYIATEPQVRKEYLKAMLRSTGAWATLAGAGKLMGAEVSMDPTNADFGKIKSGNLRMDPGGGFLQWLVLSSRLATAESTSSTSGKTSNLLKAKGPYDPIYGSTIGNFASNKLHPRLKQLYDVAYANKSRPYHVIEREFQTWLPLITGDLIDIAKEEPEMLPLLAPLMSAGIGGQFYEKGEEYNKPTISPFIEQVTGLPIKNNEISLGR